MCNASKGRGLSHNVLDEYSRRAGTAVVSFVPGHRVGQAYPLLFAAACFAGLLWLGRQPSVRVEAGLLVLAGGVAGARLGFAALHLTYFSAHPIEITWLWQGGLSWVGGAVGAVIGGVMAATFTGTSPWDLADALSVPTAIVALAAWTGCLVEACAFGRPVPGAVWAPAAYNSLGVLAPRWPTQALGMILSAVLLAALLRMGGRRPAGLVGAGTLAAVAATNTILSLTRGDPSMLIGNLRVDTVAGLAVFVGAAGVATFRIRRTAG